MKISVIEITGEYALTIEDGQKLYDVIYPLLKSGTHVILDFAGISIYVCAFMNFAIGQLYKDIDPKGLLSIENMPPHGREVVRAVVANAKRHYSMTEEERRARDLAFFSNIEES